jgi:glycosidase
LATYNGVIYAHIGLTVNGVPWQNVIGSWGNNTTQPALTQVNSTTFTLTISPDLYTYFGATAGSTITQICVVFRSSTGTQQTVDYFINVGAFQVTLNTPAVNSVTLLSPGGNLNIGATNTGGAASYVLKANGATINSTASTSNYTYNHTNITSNQNYALEVTQGTSVITKNFSVIVNPGTVTEGMPTGLEDGINYDPADTGKATLVLDAPGKDYVYVAGSFNNWQPDGNYAMKKDPTTGKFWLEITGLTPQQVYSYQYWVVDTTPIANSPALVKTADPFSTLVLSPFDDSGIPATSYPDIPAYPEGQQREVTVLQTGQTPYNWQVTNFNKPKKEDLVVYEVLIRDFDGNRNFQDLINRIDYFKNLKINAIELMPVMEYEGNESWGYNTAFHMALDKYYGPGSKLKEFIDLCHQNGIAVILDVALNHAFGRNPMVRMWMKDPDGDGWDNGPAADSPYFNQVATHSYGVGSDFNHSQALTKAYVKRVIKQWVQEFHIDGLRWDLTKGFTQNCTGSESCTNSYQQDRVNVLREYADYSWSIDPTHYVIFEHLGADNEEQQWANYRIAETPSKGVMMWGEMTYPYTQLIEGYATGADLSDMGNVAHGFTAKRLIGYPESHDKDRLMYSAMTYGAAGTGSPSNNLNNALARMSAIGATSLLIPGPKMIWHFAELGMQQSIYTCTNGTINTESDATSGDCKLATKPQPQWAQDWINVPQRQQVYNDWTKFIQLKINEPVFEGNYAISPDGDNLKQRIYVYDDALPSSQLKNVVIIANFSTNTQSINPSFPYTGTWYNLLDNTSTNITNATATISLGPGEFRVFGNQQPSLGVGQLNPLGNVALYPNPASGYFTVNTNTSKVEVFSITGQLVKRFDAEVNGYQYNVNDLTNGIYLVKITDENRNAKTIKLVKQ